MGTRFQVGWAQRGPALPQWPWRTWASRVGMRGLGVGKTETAPPEDEVGGVPPRAIGVLTGYYGRGPPPGVV